MGWRPYHDGLAQSHLVTQETASASVQDVFDPFDLVPVQLLVGVGRVLVSWLVY